MNKPALLTCMAIMLPRLSRVVGSLSGPPIGELTRRHYPPDSAIALVVVAAHIIPYCVRWLKVTRSQVQGCSLYGIFPTSRYPGVHSLAVISEKGYVSSPSVYSTRYCWHLESNVLSIDRLMEMTTEN